MAEWVLEQDFPQTAPIPRELALWILDTPESALIPLMRSLTRRYPALKLYSLPRLRPVRQVELGFRGSSGIEDAFLDLQRELTREGIGFVTRPPSTD
jgi:molybdopterin-biosynthesis enzyme MoeA-like protein